MKNMVLAIGPTIINGNKRDKLILLTKKGEEYCNEMLKLKKQIEEEISINIGRENVEILKVTLRKNWLNSQKIFK